MQACVPWWSNNINTDMTKSEWVGNYSTENSFILHACEIWYLCVQKIFWANKTWTHVGTFGFCLWARRLYVSFSPPLRFNVECAFQSHTPFHAMHAWFRNRNFIVALTKGSLHLKQEKYFFNEKVSINGDYLNISLDRCIVVQMMSSQKLMEKHLNTFSALQLIEHLLRYNCTKEIFSKRRNSCLCLRL